MSRDPSDKALDCSKLLKHHDISVDMLNYAIYGIHNKLYESMTILEQLVYLLLSDQTLKTTTAPAIVS